MMIVIPLNRNYVWFATLHSVGCLNRAMNIDCLQSFWIYFIHRIFWLIIQINQSAKNFPPVYFNENYTTRLKTIQSVQIILILIIITL